MIDPCKLARPRLVEAPTPIRSHRRRGSGHLHLRAQWSYCNRSDLCNCCADCLLSGFPIIPAGSPKPTMKKESVTQQISSHRVPILQQLYPPLRHTAIPVCPIPNSFLPRKYFPCFPSFPISGAWHLACDLPDNLNIRGPKGEREKIKMKTSPQTILTEIIEGDHCDLMPKRGLFFLALTVSDTVWCLLMEDKKRL